nr:hypothetical protein [Azospirillum brasilense]
MQARADESARLIEWGFREFATYALFKAGETVDQVPLWLGAQDTVPVTVPEDMKVTMARADRSGMKVSLVSNAPVAAPVKKGDVVGKVVVSAPGFPGKEFPVVAAQDVEKLGFVGRALAAAKFLIFGAS